MENQQGMSVTFEKFTWTIDEFSKKNIKKLRSMAFQIGGCRWRILARKDVDYLSLYLKLKVKGSLPPSGWTKFAYFRLALINQVDSNKSIVKETQHKFNPGYRIWGSLFVHISDFHNPNQGYLVNNTCIIEAHVSVSDVSFKDIQDKVTRSISIIPTHNTNNTSDQDQGAKSSFGTPSSKTYESSQTEYELQEDQKTASSDLTLSPKQECTLSEPKEVPLTPLGELIDFNALGLEEMDFFPLLEKVCSCHPSLIESQRKRGARFILWAFTALGRVLYFLKTMKVRDITDDACNHLQVLWEELEFFGFDLTWLEPYVKTALGANAYLKRAEQVKNLKSNIVVLENEIRTLTAKLAVAEVELDVASRDLAEVEEGFEQKDIDAELGYGIFRRILK